jgi:hypothetical protein
MVTGGWNRKEVFIFAGRLVRVGRSDHVTDTTRNGASNRIPALNDSFKVLLQARSLLQPSPIERAQVTSQSRRPQSFGTAKCLGRVIKLDRSAHVARSAKVRQYSRS